MGFSLLRFFGMDAADSMTNNESSSTWNDIYDYMLSSTPGPFLRAVVSEVIYDPSAMDDVKVAELEANLVNPEVLRYAPRNSIIARVTTGGLDRRQGPSKTIVCLPFFPPHLCFPIKPGEQVWLIDENPELNSNVSYWMCRIPSLEYADDPNFTHNDRNVASDTKPKKKKAGESAENAQNNATEEQKRNNPYGFPNGELLENTWTLSDELDYEKIVTGSFAYNHAFTPSVVPRFTKRPGDLAMMGSNNTLICLGEVRGWTTLESKLYGKASAADPVGDEAKPRTSNATKSQVELDVQRWAPSGAIDIVAGRGRYAAIGVNPVGNMSDVGRYSWIEGTSDEVGAPPILTAPITVTNTPPEKTIDGNPIPDSEKPREKYTETNKNPVRLADASAPSNNWSANVTEGDPDFSNDSSRLWVTEGIIGLDQAFDISRPGITIPNCQFEADDAINSNNSLLGRKAVDWNSANGNWMDDSEEIDNTVTAVSRPDVTDGSSPVAAAVMKSDEIRIIARKKDKNVPVEGCAELNGSIRIIKEGVHNGPGDGASIFLLPDGSIQLSGSKLFLGRPSANRDDELSLNAGPYMTPRMVHTEWGSGGDKSIDAEGNAVAGDEVIIENSCQPWVRFGVLQAILEELFNTLEEFSSNLSKTVPQSGVAFEVTNPMAFTGFTSQLNSIKEDFSTPDNQYGAFGGLASVRIFGE